MNALNNSGGCDWAWGGAQAGGHRGEGGRKWDPRGSGGGRTSSSPEVLLVTPPAVPMFPGSVVRLMAGGGAAKANSWRIMMFVILNNVNNNYIHSIHRAGGGGSRSSTCDLSCHQTTCLHPFLTFVYYSWLASLQVSANANLLPPLGNSSNPRGSKILGS